MSKAHGWPTLLQPARCHGTKIRTQEVFVVCDAEIGLGLQTKRLHHDLVVCTRSAIL